jgi:predicted kinase
VATAAILVNGLPASGKSTLSVKLALLLGCPVLSKDILKEQLAGLTGPAASGTTLGAIAMETIWSLAAAIPDGVVIDSFWLSGRDDDFARAGIARAGATRVVEIWCDVPEAEARARYEARERHPVHTPEFGPWAGAMPLAIWPVVRVNTLAPVDFDELLPRLAGHLLG